MSMPARGTRGRREQERGRRGTEEQALGRRGTKEQARGTKGTMEPVRGTMGMKELALGRRGKPAQGTLDTLGQALGRRGMKELVRGKRGMREHVPGTTEPVQGRRSTTGRMLVRGPTYTARRGKQLIACRTHSHSGTRLAIRCSMPVGRLRRRSPHGCESHTHTTKTNPTDLLLCQQQDS